VVIHRDTKGQTASDAMVRLKTLSSLDSHFGVSAAAKRQSRDSTTVRVVGSCSCRAGGQRIHMYFANATAG
jgi:hypothetical protein